MPYPAGGLRKRGGEDGVVAVAERAKRLGDAEATEAGKGVVSGDRQTIDEATNNVAQDVVEKTEAAGTLYSGAARPPLLRDGRGDRAPYIRSRLVTEIVAVLRPRVVIHLHDGILTVA